MTLKRYVSDHSRTVRVKPLVFTEVISVSTLRFHLWSVSRVVNPAVTAGSERKK